MSTDMNILKQIIAQVVQEMTTEDSATTLPVAELAVVAPVLGDTTTMTATAAGKLTLVEIEPTERGSDPREVVVTVSPALSTLIHEAIIDLPRAAVFKEVAAGIEEEGPKHRFMEVYKTADTGLIAHQAAELSGSDAGIGIQSRGATITHQRNLLLLSNAELFSQSPLIDLETFRAIGRNAAKYVKDESP